MPKIIDTSNFSNIENLTELFISNVLNIIEYHNKNTKVENIPEKTKDDEFLSIDEAACFLKISKSTLYKKTQNRMIPHIKKMGRLYFSKKELISFLKTGKMPTVYDIIDSAKNHRRS